MRDMDEHAPTPAPQRRWLRFSLRGLFVAITIFGCWLGYQLNWIRQRHAWLASPEAKSENFFLTRENDHPPGMLWLFGEPGFDSIHLTMPPRKIAREGSPVLTPEEMERARLVQRLFPEAPLAVWVQCEGGYELADYPD